MPRQRLSFLKLQDIRLNPWFEVRNESNLSDLHIFMISLIVMCILIAMEYLHHKWCSGVATSHPKDGKHQGKNCRWHYKSPIQKPDRTFTENPDVSASGKT